MNQDETTPRRDFLKKSVAGTVALSAGLSATAALLQSFSAEAEKTADYSALQNPHATNEKEFRMGVIGPAELSLVTSQIAVQNATQKNAK